MKIDLTGKVALVTASTGGIGFAIARGLAESGAEVIVNGRSVDSVNKGIQALQQVVPGVQVRAAIADLSSQEGVDELLRVATHVDILVNNAGIYGQQDFYSTDDETWERYWQTNRDVRRAPLPCPVARHGTKGLGSGSVYLVRIGLQYSCGYDPLWRDKNRPALAGARSGEVRGRQRRDGEQRTAGPDNVGRFCRDDERRNRKNR